MRKLDEAREQLDKVFTADKDYPNLALERGQLYEDSGDIEKALEAFKAAYDKAPNDLDLMLRVGAAYVQIGRPDDAIPLLEKVRKQRTNSAEAEHFMGRALLLQGPLQEAQAVRHLKRAVEIDPNRPEYHLYVGWAANESTPPDIIVAQAEIEKALSLDKLLADGYWQHGDILRKLGRVEDGIRDLKRALELKPARFQAHASLAQCYEQKNQDDQALAEWAKAVAADDKRSDWQYLYGRLLDEHNRADAVTHLAFAAVEGAKLTPRPGWVVQSEFFAGRALKKAGKKQDAIDRLNLFMDLATANNPDRRDALKLLADLGAPWQGR
jgi:tetratricopeptide (TPR) repeat protein